MCVYMCVYIYIYIHVYIYIYIYIYRERERESRPGKRGTAKGKVKFGETSFRTPVGRKSGLTMKPFEISSNHEITRRSRLGHLQHRSPSGKRDGYSLQGGAVGGGCSGWG